MVLQLYADPCTVNCRKVIAALDQLGSEWELKFIDFPNNQHRSDEYRRINPFATVPTLVHDGLILTESNAILQYVADLNPSGFYPSDLKKRAEINCWLFWEASAWFPCNYVYLVENVFEDEPNLAAVDAQAPRFHRLASGLDAALGKHKFVVGDQVTIADFAVAAPMHLWELQKLPLANYSNILRWYKEIAKLPSWSRSQAAVDKSLEEDG